MVPIIHDCSSPLPVQLKDRGSWLGAHHDLKEACWTDSHAAPPLPLCLDAAAGGRRRYRVFSAAHRSYPWGRHGKVGMQRDYTHAEPCST